MSTELAEIREQLKAPFALDDIDFLPKGKVERDGKTLCMALPYADPRVYQDRLNEVAYGEWSTPAPVVIAAGNKLICYVTVILCGVPHTDVGEATNNEENTGTEAWAQAFKRACSQFGLGRYLYDLEKEWVPFNPQRKMIDLDRAGRQAIVRKMYQKAGIVLPSTKITDQALHDLTKPGSYEQHHRNEATPASNGHAEPEPPIENMKALISRVRMRALKLGYKTIADYERFCLDIITKRSPETLVDINALNAAMSTRELEQRTKTA